MPKSPASSARKKKINVQAVITGFGGPTTNNLVQAARLGLSTVWIGRIGDDSNGQYILDAFEKEGMDTQFIEIVPGAMSSQTWIAVDQEGQRCIYMCSNITCTITPELVRQRYEDVIAGARLFHSELCQLPLAAVLEGARIAKEHKVPVSVDYDVDVETYIHKNNLGTQRELEELLTLTDVYKSGWSITRSLTGMDEPEQAAAQILRRGTADGGHYPWRSGQLSGHYRGKGPGAGDPGQNGRQYRRGGCLYGRTGIRAAPEMASETHGRIFQRMWQLLLPGDRRAISGRSARDPPLFAGERTELVNNGSAGEGAGRPL